MKIVFSSTTPADADGYDFLDRKEFAFGDFLLGSVEDCIHINSAALMTLTELENLHWYYVLLAARNLKIEGTLSFGVRLPRSIQDTRIRFFADIEGDIENEDEAE